jgi:hypothetical protein
MAARIATIMARFQAITASSIVEKLSGGRRPFSLESDRPIQQNMARKSVHLKPANNPREIDIAAARAKKTQASAIDSRLSAFLGHS